MTTTDTIAHWLQLLREEARRTSMARTARLLGYSTATISLVLAGKYPGKTDRIARAVLATLDKLICPHSGEQISSATCRATALAVAPTHHPMKLSHWRACQRCPNRPQGEQP
jgi:hypothetical protein